MADTVCHPQVLAIMMIYHATSIPMPEHLLTRLCRALHTFVAANRPVIGGTQAPLFPGKEACLRAEKDGGIEFECGEQQKFATCAGDERPALAGPILIARLGSCTDRSPRRLS